MKPRRITGRRAEGRAVERERAERIKDIFIVGTDTGVGKTVLSLLLMQFFFEEGLNPFYIKPLQTGCSDPYDTDSDAGFIYDHTKELQGKDPTESVLYCFENPKAPLFAARDQGEKIHPDTILRTVKEKRRRHHPLIIEAAGGLLVPVTDDMLVIDLVQKVGAAPLIAARAGLGTINHTLLTIETMRSRGLEPLGVVFMDGGATPTSETMILENREAVEAFAGIPVTGVIGKIDDFSAPTESCSRVVNKILQIIV